MKGSDLLTSTRRISPLNEGRDTFVDLRQQRLMSADVEAIGTIVLDAAQSSGQSELSLSSKLPLKFYQQFGELQYQAYEKRIALQPGGQKLLGELRAKEGTESKDRMKLLLGIEYVEVLCSLGKDALKLLRAYGQSTQEFTALPQGFDFTSKLLTGLEDKRGQRHYLSPELVATIASGTHDAWRNVSLREMGEQHRPLSTSGSLNPKQLFQDLRLLPLDAANKNALGGLLLAEMLGKMRESDFDNLLVVAPTGNPKGLSLQIASYDNSSKWGPEGSIDRFEIAGRPDSANAQFKNDWFERPVYAEKREHFTKALSNLRSELLRQEQQEVLPHVFCASDKLSAVFTPEFEQILKETHVLAQARDIWLMQIEKVGMHLLEAVDLSSNRPANAAQMVSEALALSENGSNEKLNSLIESSERSYLVQKNKLQLLSGCPSSDLAKLEGSSLIGLEDLPRYFSEMRALIDQTEHSSLSPEFKQRGGIVYDYYDVDFFKKHLIGTSDGACPLLVDVQCGKLNGFFVYYLPAGIPTGNLNVPQKFQNDTSSSFAELLRANAPHTCDRLIRSMLCHLQLTQAEWSTGYCYETNERSMRALAKRGHIALYLDSVTVSLPEGKFQEFVRMECPVTEENRIALLPVAKIISDSFDRR